ncbi:MAG: M3 family metallopeptidase [Dysgonamonadaceae bacterium]|jgi:peptidyl-dipeptidase Dcp|nr:M3 family metallopeptidase [Dysgonamonadaceae bacterium]
MKKFNLSVIIVLTVFCMTACKDKQSANPFFEKWENAYEIPPFDRMTVANYRDAFLKGMEEQTAEIEAIVNNPETPSFDNVLVALDASGQLLNKVSGVFFAESGSNGTEEILSLESEIIPLLTQHSDKILMDKRLFGKVESVKEQANVADLTPEDRRLLHETYLDFVRSGVNLPEDQASELKKINEELSRLENKFGQNVLNETGSYQLVIDKEDDLAGLSAGQIASAADRAGKAGLTGKWVFGLDNPSIMPFLASSDNKEGRNKLLNAYLNRCNNNNEYDNKEILKNIVVLRNKKAKLLGYNNFAEYILERRMAKNPKNVYALLNKIWTPGLKKAKEELAGMQALVGKGSVLSSSDWRYFAEKLKAAKYDLSEEALRPYFQAENVVNGLFWVTNQLYGVAFKERTDLPKPNRDVRTFVCIDHDGQTELGVLFIDLYARPGLKTVGAWCGTYRDACQDAAGKRILPLTYVCCNFPAPIGNEPSLLTSDDAETFFHEMGHAMNNLFQNVKYHATGHVPSDFVELPSQFMEHWVFEPQVLAQYAKHYQTGEIIPQDLVDKIQAASKYGQGFATTEYMAASYLDMDYHVNVSPEAINVLKFEAGTLSSRGLIPQIPPRYRSTYFKHTFEGGYSAGYYSYIWSEVLDCDAFEAFVEAGNIFDKEIAARFRRHILEPGCIDPADELYLQFRGRKPDVNALLRNRGLE